jgi:hypothetical protein
MPQLAPLELLMFGAACTQRIRVGCAVFLTVLRTPVSFAKSIATADQLSGGQLIVGVGLGWPERSEGFGIEPSTRVARFTEGLRCVGPFAWATGFIGAGIVSTAQFAEQVRTVRGLLDGDGRRAFPISKRVYINVDDDRERAARWSTRAPSSLS